MAKPIRASNIQLKPENYLSADKLKDYEDLEKRLDDLKPSEKRYYEMLQRWALLSHIQAVKHMDKLVK